MNQTAPKVITIPPKPELAQGKAVQRQLRVAAYCRVSTDNEEQLTRMSTGVVIDGRKTAPAKVRVLQQEQGRVVLEIVLYEGRNREIRKMCEALGLEVARLKRVAIGPVRLGMLAQGKHRELTKEEIRGLLAEAGKGKGGEPRDTDPSHGGQRKRTGTAGPGRRGRR